MTRSRLREVSQCATPIRSRSRVVTPTKQMAKRASITPGNRTPGMRTPGNRTPGSRTPIRRFKEILTDDNDRKFTLAEDYVIIKEYTKVRNNSVKQTASNLVKALGRPKAAIEHRVAVIISKLTQKDLDSVS